VQHEQGRQHERDSAGLIDRAIAVIAPRESVANSSRLSSQRPSTLPMSGCGLLTATAPATSALFTVV
jgi:hypothetical protein